MKINTLPSTTIPRLYFNRLILSVNLVSCPEWLHSSPHCSQKEPDKHCFSAAAVRSRDQCSNQAGGQPATPGIPGGTRWDGQPAAEQRSTCQHRHQGQTHALFWLMLICEDSSAYKWAGLHWIFNTSVLYVFQSGLTALHLTAQEDRVNAAEVLAKHDANLDQQTKVLHLSIVYIISTKLRINTHEKYYYCHSFTVF